jgi:hypothetical protein
MTQHYLLPCSCGLKIRVVPAQAGGQATCGCGQSVAVPTLRGLRTLEPATPDAQGRVVAGWSAAHGMCFAGGLVLSLVGVALVAFHAYRYTQFSELTVDHTDAVAAFHTAEVDKLSAVQLFDEWSQITAAGLGEKMTPPWEAARQLIAGNKFWMQFGGGAIAVGIVLSILSVFVARPPA